MKNKPQNAIISPNKPGEYTVDTIPPKRCDILLSLWTDHARLEQLRADIHDHKKEPCPTWKFEVWIIQVKAQLTNAALEVLKDTDIDDLKQSIEEIKKELKLDVR